MKVRHLYEQIKPRQVKGWPRSWQKLEERLRGIFKNQTIITLPDTHSVELIASTPPLDIGESVLLIDFWPHLTHPELPICPSSLEATEALEKEKAEKQSRLQRDVMKWVPIMRENWEREIKQQ